MNLQELWELVVQIPHDVLVPALAVFAVIGLLKALGAIKESGQAQFALALLSFLTGGSASVNSLSETLVVAFIALFAAIYHRLWEWAKAFLASRGESGAAAALFMAKPLG